MAQMLLLMQDSCQLWGRLKLARMLQHKKTLDNVTKVCTSWDRGRGLASVVNCSSYL